MKKPRNTEEVKEAVEENVAETVENSTEETRRTPQSKVKLTARVNADLPDGRFVREGESFEVDQEYADRLKSERDTRFY
jgi:hypothetical protein